MKFSGFAGIWRSQDENCFFNFADCRVHGHRWSHGGARSFSDRLPVPSCRDGRLTLLQRLGACLRQSDARLRANGTNRQTGQISMRQASAGAIDTGSWGTGVELRLPRHGRHLPPLRARLAHVAPRRGGTGCPTRLVGGRSGCAGATAGHLYFA